MLDRLGDMLPPDAIRLLQVGDGPGHLEDSDVGQGGEAEFLRDHLQQTAAGGVRFAESDRTCTGLVLPYNSSTSPRELLPFQDVGIHSDPLHGRRSGVSFSCRQA